MRTLGVALWTMGLLMLAAAPLAAQPMISECSVSTPGPFFGDSTVDPGSVASFADTITVCDTVEIADTQVSTVFTHAFIGDVDMTLTSPDLVVVSLHGGSGGNTDNMDVTWSDQGVPYDSQLFTCGCLMEAFGGPNALAAFNGGSSVGDWVLDVTDTFPTSGGGTLDDWCLDLFLGVSIAVPATTVIQPGTTGTVAVTIPSTLDLAGFQFGLCHTADVTVTPIEPGADLAATNGGAGPDFFSPQVFADGVTVACVIHFPNFNSLPAGADLAVVDLGYPCTGNALSFCDTLGNPMIETTVVDTDIEVVVPHFVNGIVVCNCPCCPPQELTCVTVFGVVDLRWIDGSFYDSVDVFRNGILVETLPGGAPGDDRLFIDIPGSGEFAYEVRGNCAGGTSAMSECTVNTTPVPNDFVRGDANNDGLIDFADAVHILEFLFLNGLVPPCLDAADVNDNGTISIPEPLILLTFLFAMGDPLPPPSGFPPTDCGPDPTADALTCDNFGACP